MMRMMSGPRRASSGDTAAALRTILAPTLLLVPELDLYNPVEDAVEAAALIPHAELVRLGGNSGHAVAADTSPQLAEISRAIGKFLERVRSLSPAGAATDPSCRRFLTPPRGRVTFRTKLYWRPQKNKSPGGNRCRNY